jgi:hypothetical protein
MAYLFSAALAAYRRDNFAERSQITISCVAALAHPCRNIQHPNHGVGNAGLACV